MARVYPRPRGEAWVEGSAIFLRAGLSPPTRGSQPRVHEARRELGSIPAHAGKPGGEGDDRGDPRVYPRPRGEAVTASQGPVHGWGLSPPTRGSRQASNAEHRGSGSIPAHAGKPWPIAHRSTAAGVYPRPRGEAPQMYSERQNGDGLSPPTRGSLGNPVVVARYQGSIPAHAGKPGRGDEVYGRPRVYPRPRGEAGGGG